MSEVAFNVAFSGMRFGPNKRALAHRDTCPCGAGHPETVEHTFKDCVRSSVIWRRVTDAYAWRATTGETKLDPTNPRTVLMGDRSAHWLYETEEAEFAGLEEPWAVIRQPCGLFLRSATRTPHHTRAPGARRLSSSKKSRRSRSDSQATGGALHVTHGAQTVGVA